MVSKRKPTRGGEKVSSKLAGWKYVHRKQIKYKVTSALLFAIITGFYSGLFIAYIARPVKAESNYTEIIEREAKEANISSLPTISSPTNTSISQKEAKIPRLLSISSPTNTSIS